MEDVKSVIENYTIESNNKINTLTKERDNLQSQIILLERKNDKLNDTNRAEIIKLNDE